MSIAGGYYKAVEAAARCGMDVVQIFSKNNNQWRAKPISDEDVALFRDTLRDLKIAHPVAHSSYLINLGAPDDTLWQKSIDAMVVELQRAAQLGVPFVVMHPGAFTTSSEEAGLARIVAGIDAIHAKLPRSKSQILLENTAGQGSCLGHRFEHLAAIINGARQGDRLGVCFDTCHAFAAGYPLSERKDYLRTLRAFDAVVGLDRIRAFHLNDSKRGLGSRVDRHEHIGRGQLGSAAFAHLLNDRRLRYVPMYLETPKGTHDGEEWDTINLRTLRALITKQR
jgi:deoxyribonuclease-4